MSRKLVLANIAAIAILFCASAARSASFTISGKGTVTSGACTGAVYADTCRSGNCVCLAVQSGKVTGSFKGSSQVSATIDRGVETGFPPLKCGPAFITATATLKNRQGSKTAVLDITAAHCQNGSLTGEWGAETPVSGSGSVSGSANASTGKLSMTFKGAIQ